MAKATTQTAKKNSEPILIKQQHDNFNGLVALWSKDDSYFIVQSRKNITTALIDDIEEAEEQYNIFCNDTMF